MYCSYSPEVSEEGCRLLIQEVPFSHQLPSWPLWLWLCHQLPSQPGRCDGAVPWGKQSAVGPQSASVPLNCVLSLSLSPLFASCCLQSLGTLSPYSQVMAPVGTSSLSPAVTGCPCSGSAGALLNLPLPGNSPRWRKTEGLYPGWSCPSGTKESSVQALLGRVDPGCSFCPMEGDTSNWE